jgi:hypothetical protein
MTIRNRIKEHRRVRAGDLVPHELNYRLHPAAQRDALLALYDAVGFARSLLVFELPDGRLKLIDGHLRRDLSPDLLVDVEVLDVNEEEARALLLSIDPLAALAEADAEAHARLREMTATDDEALAALWQQDAEERAALPPEPEAAASEQFLILIICRDEDEQTALLDLLQKEGHACRALVS